jgi:hypothetical protein
MNELNRTEGRLTTADIAAGTANPARGPQVQSGVAREDGDRGDSYRPTAVQNETTSRRDWDNSPEGGRWRLRNVPVFRL